ncbi:hypothetical protein COD09_24660 [Bacillus cereus]|uniref:Uncharacterized protein n=1 Tax=Bacillus cereus TaxID=1396 RepID=A0A2C1D0W9_BACCE|nr:hypothetical protein COD09_24660 [Bacillus cereus]
MKVYSNQFSILMLLMLTIGQSLVPIIASAKELNTVGLLDSFKLDKSNLQSGELTEITVNFSGKNGSRLQPGDTLTHCLQN